MHQYMSRSLFKGDLPVPLVSEHHFFYNPQDRCVELRHLAHPFKMARKMWRLDIQSRTMSRALENNVKERLLDPHSTVTRQLATQIPDSFEPSQYVVVSELGGTVKASLPRLGLTFQVDSKSSSSTPPLTCDAYPDSRVDLSSQSFGALSGLKSKLVLIESLENSPVLRVLIPFGRIESSRLQEHYEVVGCTAGYDADKQVAFAEYIVDPQLNRLRATGGLRSVLYKSCCMPTLVVSFRTL